MAIAYGSYTSSPQLVEKKYHIRQLTQVFAGSTFGSLFILSLNKNKA